LDDGLNGGKDRAHDILTAFDHNNQGGIEILGREGGVGNKIKKGIWQGGNVKCGNPESSKVEWKGKRPIREMEATGVN